MFLTPILTSFSHRCVQLVTKANGAIKLKAANGGRGRFFIAVENCPIISNKRQ